MNRDPHLPLTETVYYVLLALLQPAHGYLIMSRVEEMSGGQVRLAPGTLYGALDNLGKQKLINVPWSVQTLSDSLTRQVQASSVKDIYRYLPSVQGDGVRPQTRGMQGSVVQNSMIDGLNVVSTTEYPAEQFQRIEVLNGMAGALYGPANPAGMFNLVSKRPTDVPLRRVTVGGGTASGANAALDLSGPVDAIDRVKYRLNLRDQDGSSYTHGSRQRNQYAGLALDFQLTDLLAALEGETVALKVPDFPTFQLIAEVFSLMLLTGW